MIAKEYFGPATPGQKGALKTKSNITKKLGIGSL